MNILALDIATVTGWAFGAPGSVPRAGTIRWADVGSSNAAVGCGVAGDSPGSLNHGRVDFEPQVSDVHGGVFPEAADEQERCADWDRDGRRQNVGC